MARPQVDPCVAGACWLPAFQPFLLEWDTPGFFSTRMPFAGTTGLRTLISRPKRRNLRSAARNNDRRVSIQPKLRRPTTIRPYAIFNGLRLFAVFHAWPH